MAFAARYPISILVVLLAVIATASVFAFGRPEYHPRYESKMIDFSDVHYYSPATVRRAFAAEGIALRYSADGPGMGSAWLSNEPKPWQASALQVVIGPRKGKGSFGPKLVSYDERFGNVMVTYGGTDETLRGRIDDAVAALR